MRAETKAQLERLVARQESVAQELQNIHGTILTEEDGTRRQQLMDREARLLSVLKHYHDKIEVLLLKSEDPFEELAEELAKVFIEPLLAIFKWPHMQLVHQKKA